MADQRLRISNFDGGVSDDNKFGPPNSFGIGRSIDFRKSPGLLSLQKKLTKESSSTIVTEIHDAVRVDQNSGDVYLAGGTRIYKRSAGANGSAGTYSVASSSGNLLDVRDLDYRPDVDALFLIDQETIHEYSPLSNSPAFEYNKYRRYDSVSQTNSGGAYSLPSAISESALYTFTLNDEPIYSVIFRVSVKGTGNWTVTIHDGANHSIGSATVANGSLPTAGNDAEFVFTTPLRGKIGTEYHVHITSSDATGSVLSSALNTLDAAQITIRANRLVDAGDYGHRTFQVGAKTFICNERYLAEWEILDTATDATAGWDSHRLVFPSECISIGAAKYNEYMAIACAIKRGSDTTNTAPTEGKIIFWDTTSVFYQFDLDVPQGAPNSLFSQDNILYWEAKGRWYRWAGGDIEMVYEFPGVDDFEALSGGPSTDLYLKAGRQVMASKDGLVKVGFPYATANANVEHGVYSYGQSKGFMPKAVGHDHILSTGHTQTQLDTSTSPDTPITGITLVKNFGNNLLVAWKDVVSSTITYGVDYFNDTSGPSETGRWASLWFDNGTPDKQKTPKAIKIRFKPLESGCTVTPIVEYDRSGSFSSGTPATAGATEVVYGLDTSDQFYEVRFGYDLASSSGNQIELISVSFKFDDNEENEVDTEGI